MERSSHNQYYSVKARDAINRRLYNNQSFVETAIYCVFGMSLGYIIFITEELQVSR
ncbi:hypothetical protein GTQ43_26865 [Nostoc sp. KVJ3]|uniref:hypothetical protein n=1 Tax=Nostoc sp. KVJ3 TaxID=457945 RepID=UPI00223816F3|nr:hypothetical protein [Nostoc sp. KVJ3]MCW5317294.1 hypothetical protein [Nostoc sp. KVJ3]